MFFNLFPRIVILEVNLTPPQIMQAIHDNINKETAFLKTIFNSKLLEGSTSGKEFDVNFTYDKSINKQGQIFLHGETTELENGFIIGASSDINMPDLRRKINQFNLKLNGYALP
jgi:hypothetical protein